MTTREQMTTAAEAMLRQYRDEESNGIDQDDAAGLCKSILVHFEKESVWLCLYHHKHGTDVGAYTSEDAAHIGACNIILDYLFDVDSPDTRKAIVAAIGEHDYGKAMSLYTDAIPEEAFEIVDRSVATLDDSYLTERHAKALEQIAQDEADTEDE